jgi:hypothetical protein
MNELKLALPVLNTAEQYKEARRLVKEFGLNNLHDSYPEHFDQGKIKPTSNFFSKVVSGIIKNPISHPEGYSIFHDEFEVMQNTPENDKNWNNPEKAGSSSMSQFHKFIVPKSDEWTNFNVLTMKPDFLGSLDKMERLGVVYAAMYGIEKSNLEFFFHCVHNSIWTLHLHMIDKTRTGPSYDQNQYKHLLLDDVRKVLGEEN